AAVPLGGLLGPVPGVGDRRRVPAGRGRVGEGHHRLLADGARSMNEMLAQAPPFTEPHVAPNQWAYIRDALKQGKLDGNGPYTQRAAAFIRRVIEASAVLLTPSCTHALEMSAIALDLEPGDEVIVPAFSYAPTASAFALRGARL